MRRFVSLTLAALAISGCAAPEFRLVSRFSAGEERVYRVVAVAEVSIAAAELRSTETTRLEATTSIRVEQTDATGSTLLLTITPERFTRDGEPVDLPTEQRVRIQVHPEGQIGTVTPLEGTGQLDAAQIEDLVPLIGPPLPGRRVHLSDRWSRPIRAPVSTPTASPTPSPTPTATTTAGTQNARLAALRVIDGYDCAVVALSTRRAVVREREIGGTVLRLEGVEYAAGEIAFAFREGLSVSVRSEGEARLAISQTTGGGGVVIRSNSVLTLIRRTGVD